MNRPTAPAARAALTLALALLPGAAVASSPAAAATAAWRDCRALPARDRVFVRDLWWPPGWLHAVLLTKAQANLLSTAGSFGQPVEVARGSLFRLDVRDYGWNRSPRKGRPSGVEVWEKLAAIDVFFHSKYLLREDAVFTVYYPPNCAPPARPPPAGSRWFAAGKNPDGSPFPAGYYDGDRLVLRAAAPAATAPGHSAGSREVTVKAGESIDRPALWANPLVETAPGESVRAHDDLRRMTYSEAPLLMGPWWLAQVSRQTSLANEDNSVGYYTWLGVKTRQDVFDLAGVDPGLAARVYSDWRAVIKKSGISAQNRIAVVIKGATGDYWFTLDTFKEKGRGVAVRNLLPGEFDADAEEHIFHLPNGLVGWALVAVKDNAKAGIKAGDLQETAPDKVGGDRSALNPSEDLRVHVGRCFNCHGVNKDMIRPLDDWARKTYRRDKTLLLDPDKRTHDQLRSLYLRPLDAVEDDRRAHSRAIARMTTTGAPEDRGLTVAGFSRIYAESFNKYAYEDVTLQTAADELGVTTLKLQGALKKYNADRGGSDTVIGVFIDNRPGTVSRLEWEASVQFAAALAYGLAVPEVEKRVKVKR